MLITLGPSTIYFLYNMEGIILRNLRFNCDIDGKEKCTINSKVAQTKAYRW